MKMVISALLMLSAVGAAYASTEVDFSAPTSCPTYCTGYTVTDGNTVSQVNVQLSSTYTGAPFKVTAVINGKTYQGLTTNANPSDGTLYNVVISGTGGLLPGDGSYVTANINLLYGRKCAGKYSCHTVYYADSGSFTFP